MKILAFQNPNFKIFFDFKILDLILDFAWLQYFSVPKSSIQNFSWLQVLRFPTYWIEEFG